MARILAALLLIPLAFGACGVEEDDHTPASESLRLAATAGELSLTAPTPFQKLSEGDSVAVAVAVAGVAVEPGGHGIRYYLDGVALGDRHDLAPYVIADTVAGQRHVAARLLTPSGVELDHAGALDGRYIRVSRPCEIDADCGDGLDCSQESCVSSECRYGTVGAECCDHALECGAGRHCVAGSCADCASNADCQDDDPCTFDACSAGGLCVHVAGAECCDHDSDCDDGSTCTIDACVGGTCGYTPDNDPTCCDVDADCKPADPCVGYVCYFRTVGVDEPVGRCRYGPPGPLCCDTHGDCDDGNACTDDRCDIVDGDEAGTCVFESAGGGCCLFHAECDDHDIATLDRCVANACENTPVPGYCELPATAPVVINEFQAAPVSGVSKGWWVELHNPTADRVIDLIGWRVVVNGVPHTIGVDNLVTGGPNGRLLFPGGFFVVTGGSSADNGGLLPNAFVEGFHLPHPAATLELRDADDVMADTVTYGLDWPWQTGHSFELRHPHLDNTSKSSWRAAGTNVKRSLNRRYGNPHLGQWGSPRTPNYSSRGGVPDSDCQAQLLPDAHPCDAGVCGWRSRCEVLRGEGCCQSDEDCYDGNSCTVDRCADGTCAPPEPIDACCLTNTDCFDGNPCNVDRCVAGSCRFSPNIVPNCNTQDADGDGADNDVDCAPFNPSVHPGAFDRCNGIDDDCDGNTDENHVVELSECGTGACATFGTTACVQGSVTPICTPLSAPATVDSVCDGVDEDCDGSTDEDVEGVETCDGTDEDCDGLIDEDFGVGLPCDGQDGDTCERGVRACLDLAQTYCRDSQPIGNGGAPVTYLAFDELGGTGTNDISGNAHHGLLEQARWSIHPKRGRGAVSLNGVDGAVSVPTDGMTNRSGSIAVWVRPNGWSGGASSAHGIFQTDSGVNSANWLSLFKWTGDIFYFRLGTAGSCCANDLTFPAAPHFSAGKWTHVVATWDQASDHMRVYMDGALVKARSGVSWTGPPLHTNGHLGVGHERYLRGDLDEALFFDRPLEAEEVTAIYDAGAHLTWVNAEICDGFDNDCDAITDEGVQVLESCNGFDDDCDGETDEDITAPELCDGEDNNCDGRVDESFGLAEACDGDDDDSCLDGSRVCRADGLGAVCIDEGLVAWLPLDEVAGAIAADATGHGRDGIVSGATRDATVKKAGSGSLYLDGVGGSIAVPTDGLTNKRGTIAMWVRPDGFHGGSGTARGLFQTDSGVNSSNWLSIFKWTGGIFYFRLGTAGSCCSNDLTFNPTPYLHDGEWTHVAATWDARSDSMRVFMNGHLVAHRNAVTWAGPPLHLTATIGAGHNAWWKGWIDEVVTADYAMAPDEVMALVAGGVSSDAIDAEICDGKDNDCDGYTDEDILAVETCNGRDDDCDGVTDTDIDAVELCNGFDDDCDGLIDEGFSIGGACDGPDPDLCLDGTTTCAPDGSGVVCQDRGIAMLLGFDEFAGTTAADGSGQGHDGALVGGQWSNDARRGSGSVYLNGGGHHVQVPSAAMNNKSGTLAVWVKPDGWGGGDYQARGIFQTDSGVNSANWLSLFKWFGTTFYFRLGTSGSCCANDVTFNSGANFQADRWTHVVATWDRDSDHMRVYMDGVLTAQRTGLDWNGPTLHATAALGRGHNEWWKGWMDELVALDYALTADEVQALYDTGAGGSLVDVEVCDGVDNDCDGETDEGINQAEVCNGVDDDCDGETDEGIVTDELCNGIDDDCDGETDEGFVVGVACDGDDSDACADGLTRCADDGVGTVCQDRGTVTYLRFDAGAGQVAPDYAGNGNTGELRGAGWSMTEHVAGGGSVEITGAGQHVALPTQGMSNRSGTIAVWLRPSGWNGGDSAARGVFQTDSGVNSANWLSLFKWSGNIFYFRLGTQGSCCGNDLTFAPAAFLRDGEWVHLVATWDQETDSMRVYFDGVLAAQRSGVTWNGPPLHATARLGVGHDQYWRGHMDELVVLDYALDQDEVAALHTDGLAPGAIDVEVCDGTDNDCDGETDEDVAVAEACNGVDDDCDGETDEGITAAELCNGLDDDCDGETDEGFAIGLACDGADLDVCLDGVMECLVDQSDSVCVERGLSLYLPLDDVLPAEALDQSGHERHGTVEGALLSSDATIGSGARYFDGASDRIAVPTDGMTNRHGTIALWVKPDGWSGGDSHAYGIFQTDSGVNSSNWVSLFKWHGDIFYFRIGANGSCCGNDLTFPVAGHLTADTWTHVAATWDATADSMRVYIDGVLVKQRSGVLWDAPAVVPTATFGRGHDRWWLGWMDDIQVFGHALSAEQVAALAADGLLPDQIDVEICDGHDNDCDGETDEDVAASEVCDGVDNDCDGETDEEVAAAEACNGRDDDCDGSVDEGFELGGSCDGSDQDACLDGTVVCSPSAVTTMCDESRLHAYYGADTNEGPLALDDTGNNRHGALIGAGWSAGGRLGGGLSFDAAGQYVDVPAAGMTRSEGSMAVWLRPDGWHATSVLPRGIFQTSGSVNSPGWLGVFKWVGNELYVRMGSATSCCDNDLVVDPVAWLKDGEWVHLVVTWSQSGDRVRLYANGQLAGERAGLDWSGPGLSSRVHLGMGFSQSWRGGLDEPSLWRAALSAAEVGALFADGVPPSAANRERCNALDDDCDGETDEGLSCD